MNGGPRITDDQDDYLLCGQGEDCMQAREADWLMEVERRDCEMAKWPPSATAMQELVEWSEAMAA